mmetsp:Transcript_14321/g.20262  ORF Transcript_14321/g.20262 Transcript_14321/m.20262 type:complete len:320 (+) Transcript_14321:29-988(+)|eukprot:CAMPEP_0171472050 /NCGR_PEP_ID=MMETSP0946-20130122/1059_1 /TAXON_ID=109269 /ORGANISM="Vaucheria litorea, Strain CCMP2940" /LENGTH=319 /DNA_ID=CAMNT_0012001637 /DNA_START=15 /DNA_END=974 /DNA_ORIENTATION=+
MRLLSKVALLSTCGSSYANSLKKLSTTVGSTITDSTFRKTLFSSIAMVDNSLGFIGAGTMATALVKGFIRSGVANPGQIIVSDKHPATLERMRAEGVCASSNNLEVVSLSSVVILAVKPDIMSTILKEISHSINAETHLIISIAAGVTLDSIESLLPEFTRVVRVMPNTPCLVNETAAGFALGKNATEKDRDLVQKLMGSVGYACEVKENQLDAVTGLSGSGPAYVFLLIEAMADGGVRMGLPRDIALKLAAQTVKGAGAMVLSTGQHPGALKDAVSSPGGTTIAAIESLEKAGFRGAAMNAVITAAKKSEELRKPKEN